jgi:hypothetical protein
MAEEKSLSSAEQVAQSRDPQSSGISIQALKSYSRSILHSIVLGNHDASKSKLLRDIYWRTVEILASLDGKRDSIGR